MAFIREYAYRDQGDPFRFRIPKKLRKLKVGRALGKVARFAAPFIPGIGGIAAQMLPPEQQAVMQEAAVLPAPEEEVQQVDPGREAFLAFARSYGYDLGDPKPVPKRKGAAAGPKAKAAKKASKRAAKASGAAPKAHGTSARGKSLGSKVGGGLVALNQGLGWLTSKGGSLMTGGATDFASEFGSKLAYKGARGGFGGSRRSMNPANVHALRRSLRRVEGFEKLVKRIEKQYPRLKRAVHPAPFGGARKGRCK